MIQNISNKIKSLDSNPLWLIVIDNVDEEYSEFEEILSTLLCEVDIQCFILLTSRRNNICPGETMQLQQQTLLPSDAQQLIKIYRRRHHPSL